ncbi:MAG TPA: hypothetical protein VI542_11545 [Candidatus Tectomicrobia bacterium]
MGMTTLLGLAAILEAATGLALVIQPSLVALLLFGDGLAGAGMALARVAGFALLALAVACWPSREAGSGIARSARAMLTYSLPVTIYLVYLGIVAPLTGMLLWPGAAAHAVWMLLLVTAWRHDRQNPGESTP